MKTHLFYRILPLLIVLSILEIQRSDCDTKFTCPTQSGDPIPTWPTAFTSDFRVNFMKQLYTVYVRQFVDTEGRREAIDVWSPNRHIKYIRHNDTLLLIQYKGNGLSTCIVKSSSNIVLEDQDAGPYQILNKFGDLDWTKFYPSDSFVQNGVYLRSWEACFEEIKILIGYSGYDGYDWDQAKTSSQRERRRFFDYAEAQMNQDVAIFVTNHFSPVMPDDVEFQPPENVFCYGFRSDKKPPAMPNFFSYDAEMIVYENSKGISPKVSRRKVFYDFLSKIFRIDFYDPIVENQDVFSKKTAKSLSIIHDFNSSTQYNIDLALGKCSIEDNIITIDVAEVKESKSNEMLTGNEFFSLDEQKTSYNGQFMTRGYLADVYTALVPHLHGKSRYSWYFSSVRAQREERLLRMVMQPENSVGYEGRIDVHFYNFLKEEPDPSVFDITGCYNESFSKTFVLTFPANSDLKEIKNDLKLQIHLTLLEITGLRKQRVFVTEINFNKEYMFAEFKILDSPYAMKFQLIENEIPLADAISRIRKALSESQLQVYISIDKEMLILKANGFNELGEDRRLIGSTSYKEGSVIALTIGMLFLGFVLGSISLNLIISRKYGVSLFQKSTSAMNRFDNTLNESSM